MKFYICDHCGNIITYVTNRGVPVMCCGQKMTEMTPNTSDGAAEKHVPLITVDGSLVKVAVGSVAHPMTDAHFIEWIVLETKQGTQRRELKPGDMPAVDFMLCDGDEVVAAYAYCNLHGLWKGTI